MREPVQCLILSWGLGPRRGTTWGPAPTPQRYLKQEESQSAGLCQEGRP